MSGSGTVCVLGSFMMDLAAHVVRRPERGETVIGARFVRRLGGKGFNQAVAAARAGAATTMLGMLGDDDHGAAFLRALDDEEIGRDGVGVYGASGTGIGLPVIEADGSNSIVVVPLANHELRPADVERRRDDIANADVLCLQLELPIDTAICAAGIARAAGRHVLVNPAPAHPACGDVLDLATIVVPNDVEVSMLTGSPASATVESMAAALAGRYRSATVIVTNGAGGAVIGSDPPTRCVAPVVTAVDTVGAGDVFCGYLAAGIAARRTLADAVADAVAAASLAVSREGGPERTPVAAELTRSAGR